MSYDTTGPAKVHESKSLFLLILLLCLVAGGIALALHWNKIPGNIAPHLPPAASIPAAVVPDRHPAPEPRPRNNSQRKRGQPNRSNNIPEGISHPRENLTYVRGGNVYASFNTNNKNIFVSRLHQQNDNLSFELGALQRMARDAKAQLHYDATPDQVAALKALPLKTPEFTHEQQKKLIALFKAVEEAKPEAKAAAEKALVAAVADMPIPRGELKALDETIDKARDVLRPDQLDLIDHDR